MTTIKYVCELVNMHMAIAMKVSRTLAESNELEWLSYKLKRIRKVQRKLIYGER